jgi:hypothetical protein
MSTSSTVFFRIRQYVLRNLNNLHVGIEFSYKARIDLVGGEHGQPSFFPKDLINEQEGGQP